VRFVFSFVCHQDVGSSWPGASIPAALCPRCLGMYSGAFLALFLLPLATFKTNKRILSAHVFFIFQGVLLGLFPIPQPAWIKIISGHLFILGIFYLLWLNIRIKRHLFRDRESSGGYFIALALSLVLIQLIVHLWLTFVFLLMDIFSLLGLASIVLLSLATILVFMIPMTRSFVCKDYL